MIKIRPQQGPQERFIATPADIAIYGGAAGGGKTYGLLLELLRYKDVTGFRAVIFRRIYKQITSSGGLWDESLNLYTKIPGATSLKSPKHHWNFSGKARLDFDYLTYDQDCYSWQGAQICAIFFDELTHFSEFQFFYMLSRNRSMCGVKPYMRATCNPDSDSWVAEFISWWLNPETGYPIPERSGKLRYFLRTEDGGMIWGDSRAEVCEKANVDRTPGNEALPEDCKSVTFISSNIFDNQELLKKDPGYLANLKGLSLVERERLLRGNWKIRPAAGLYFKRDQTRIVKAVPDKIVSIARAWDLAATEISNANKNPDRTAGALIGRMHNGQYIVLDVIRQAASASRVRQLVQATAATDLAEHQNRRVLLPQDPGQAGKEQAQSYVKMLAGYKVESHPVTGSKVMRAEPFAAQWQQGNVLVLEGPWNEVFLDELEGFPDALHDDQVDAASDAFNAVAASNNWSAPPGDLPGRTSYWL